MIEQLQPPVALQTDPNGILTFFLVVGRPAPYTLAAGDNWIVYDGHEWFVNADQSATLEEVQALLKQAGGCTLWDV